MRPEYVHASSVIDAVHLTMVFIGTTGMWVGACHRCYTSTYTWGEFQA